MEEETNEEPKKESQSQRFVNYTKGLAMILPIIGALILGIINMFKGEPKAEKTYETLAAEFNKVKKDIVDLSGLYQKVYIKLINMQGKEEGWTSGKLYAELQQCKSNVERAAKRRGPGLLEIQQQLLEEQKQKRLLEEKRLKLMEKFSDQRKVPPQYRPLPKKLRDVQTKD